MVCKFGDLSLNNKREIRDVAQTVKVPTGVSILLSYEHAYLLFHFLYGNKLQNFML